MLNWKYRPLTFNSGRENKARIHVSDNEKKTKDLERAVEKLRTLNIVLVIDCTHISLKENDENDKSERKFTWEYPRPRNVTTWRVRSFFLFHFYFASLTIDTINSLGYSS